MKNKIHLVVLFSVWAVGILRGQSISNCAYWFDDNYAARQNAPLSINGNEAIFDGPASTTGLSIGGHIFNYRCRDASGNYSGIVSQFFIKMPEGFGAAKRIIVYEYWFDNNTPQSVAVNGALGEPFELNNTPFSVADLSIGGHIFNMRFKDNTGNWSGIVSQFFIKRPPTTPRHIVSYEYWFDNDDATETARHKTTVANPSDVFILDSGLDVSNLAIGGHVLNVRFKDDMGDWSGIVSQFFIKRPPSTPRKIVAYEYWFDNNDATQTARHFTTLSNATAATNYTFSPTNGLNTEILEAGGHILNVRFKDDVGDWSGIVSQFFIKTPSSLGQNLITAYEYWFDDNDQNRNFVRKATPSVSATLTTVSANGLSAGTHILRVRFQDVRGNWPGILSQSFLNNGSSTACVVWTNPPATGSEITTATNFLCQRGIISSAQNGTANTTTKITRGEIARLIFRAMLADDETADARFPFLDFPTPYCDLRRANKNAEWYRAAMCLSYLEFGDGISPFSRKYFRFGADTLMQRRHFFQVLFESWNVKPAASSITPFSDVTDQTVLLFYKKYIRQAADLGIATGTTFRPNDWLTVEEFYVFLYRLLQKNIPSPTIDQIEDEGNYFIPGNYTVENFSRLPSIDNGNFNHYSKTSFNIAGRGLPLEFTHTYNSYLTELPTEFFTNPDPNDETALNQRFNPLGIGWTHSYNISIQRVNAGNAQCSEGWLIFWADGSINVYDPIAKAYQTQGVYDNLTFEDFAVDSQRVVITTKNQIRYTFTGKKTGRLLYLRSIEERNKNALTLDYQLSNPLDNTSFLQLSRVYESFNNGTTGRALTFAYQTSTSFLQSVTDNIGRTIQFYIYDELEDLFTFTDAKGQITRYEYANTETFDHLLSKITLPKGNTIENAYHQRKLLSSKTSTGQAVSVDFKNNYRNGASGNTPFSTATVKTTKPNGGEYTTNYSHNLNGDPLSISTPSSTVSNIQYGTGANLRKPTTMTINSQNVAMNYDTKGNLLHIARGNVEENFEYDAKNNLKRHIDARNNATGYEYDGANTDRNLIRITRPTGGGTVTMQRNSFGQVERVTNPSNFTTQYSYDANGNLNSTTLPLSISSAATYDNASRLKTMTDPKNYVNRFEYDNNDNIIEEFDALNQRTAYAYDANENLLSITNAKNEATTMTYSQAEDYLISQTFGSHTDNFTYNEDGSLQQLTKPTATFNYIYDEKGRVLTDGYTNYTYDSRNRITSVTYQSKTIHLFYDDLDRLDYYTDYYGNTVDYGYDNNGNVTSITYPTNKTVTYEYDANNRMTTVKDWNNRILATYTYLTDDRLDNAVFYNGTRTQYGYDAAGRMTSLSNTKSNGTVISSYAFTLDKVGNHETETINEPAFTAALASLAPQSTNYGTAPFNRLSSAGNTTFGFDGSGNETQRGNESLTFDAYNRLTSAANAQYDYDGSGNRRSRTLNTTTTRYVLDILGMSQILIETDATNTPQYFYVYGASGLICRIKPDNTTHFYHYDFRGSTTAMTDANQNITHQYSYDPFGKILASTEADANAFCYVGQQGVVYETPTRYFMRARYYDPSVGRFLSEDPIWNKNLYAYGENNPVNEIDPDGNLSWNPQGIVQKIKEMKDEYGKIVTTIGEKTLSVGSLFYEELKPLDGFVKDVKKTVKATATAKQAYKIYKTDVNQLNNAQERQDYVNTSIDFLSSVGGSGVTPGVMNHFKDPVVQRGIRAYTEFPDLVKISEKDELLEELVKSKENIWRRK